MPKRVNPIPVVRVDSNNDILDEAAGGGTSMVDDAAFTPAASSVTPIGAIFDDTGPDAVDEGDVGAVRMSGIRSLHVQVRDAAGNERGLNVDASGAIAVTGAGGTQYTEDAAAAADPVGTALMLVRRDTPSATEVNADGDNVAAKAASTGAQYVELLSGTAKIGGDATNGLDVDVTRLPALVAGSANIGDVDVLTVPAPLSTTGAGTVATALRTTLGSDDPAVTALQIMDDWDETNRAAVNTIAGQVGVQGASGVVTALTQRVVLATDVALPAGTNTIGQVVGSVAHDGITPGNPVVIAGSAQVMDDTAPPNRVSAESDVTRLATDLDGSVFVIPGGPQRWTYHENSSSALTDASVHAAPGAGLSLYVETIVVSTGAATAMNVFLEEGASTILGPWYLEATAGRGLVIIFPGGRKITANTALTITTSAAIAHSIDITGFTRAA